MSALFDAYLMVDWSASSAPKTGRDSIWFCLLRRTRKGLERVALENPPTRAEAQSRLAALLRELAAEGARTLAGFDFPNAYPRGFARAAGFAGAEPWRAVWEGIAGLVRDAPDNANNRFEVAAELNRRISGGPFPFWACPAAQAGPYLAPTKLRRYDEALPERRHCEAHVPRTQPCWKLYTTGSVGGQALLGIPVQRALRGALDGAAQVWPFETGLSAGKTPIMLAEIWPSLVPVDAGEGVKDAAQVEAIGRFFAGRDERGALRRDLGGPEGLDEARRAIVLREEGWLLGAGTVGRRDYLREPAQIYARSFALVRAEAGLDRLPADVARIAERLVHACGMPDIVEDLAYSPDVAQAARKALAAGAPIVCDARMVAAGLLPRPNKVQVALAKTAPTGDTRSAAGMARASVAGAVVAIGNAPTALYRLIERIEAGGPRPAAILAFPVGFVGAAESKEALIEAGLGVPYLTLRGRRGGSALAAAAVNALLAP
jgi:precorrin-8X/cobalt-precorrin-8 methylmutase